MNLTFDQMMKIAEDAEIAAVLKTIPTPVTLELVPMDDKPAASPDGHVTLNAGGAL